MTLDEKIKEIISFAIMDGQNQIHDLKDGTATSEQVTDRMFESLNYHSDKIKKLIEELQTESYKKGYIDKGIDSILNNNKVEKRTYDL